MTTLDALSEAWVSERSEVLGEPEWLRDRRLAAYKRFLDQRWPDSRADEYWRSTRFDKRVPVDVDVVAATGDLDSPDDASALPTSLVDTLDAATPSLSLLDGRVVETSVPVEVAEAGVVVTDLATAAVEHPELVRAHLGSLTTSNPDGSGSHEDRTITANDAAWTSGVFIHVPAEVELDAPIGIHLHVTQPGAHLPRVLVVVERHTRATVYLEHTSADVDDATLVDEVVEAVVGDAARLDLLSLNEWGHGVTHLALQKAGVHRDATYRHLSVNIGGATIRLRPEVDLLGPGASCFPTGVYFADEGQHFDLQPYIRHLAPRASSDVLYKGALQGRSRTVFRGNVFVAEDAVGTVTDENNRTLILTDGAKADSTPFLEILCADVTAGHGSATGQIDARHLFYLESRGIGRQQALRLIVHGFFREVLDRLALPGVEQRALAHIEQEVDRADLDHLGVTGITPEGDASAGTSTERDDVDVERDELVTSVTREMVGKDR